MATSKQFLDQVKTGNVAAALQAALENAGSLTIVTHIAGEGSVDDLPESHKILTHIDAVAGTIETAIGDQFIHDGPHQALCAGHMQQVVAGCSSVRDNIDSLQALLDLVTEQDASLNTITATEDIASPQSLAAPATAEDEAVVPQGHPLVAEGNVEAPSLGATALGLGAVAGLGVAGAALDSPAEDSMLDGLEQDSPQAEGMLENLALESLDSAQGEETAPELLSEDALLDGLVSGEAPPAESSTSDFNWGEESSLDVSLGEPLESAGLDDVLAPDAGSMPDASSTVDGSPADLGADLGLGDALQLDESPGLDDSLNLGDESLGLGDESISLGDELSGDASLELDGMLELDTPPTAAAVDHSSGDDFASADLDQGLELGGDLGQDLTLESDLSLDNVPELGNELNLDDNMGLGSDLESEMAPESNVFGDDLGLDLSHPPQDEGDVETELLMADAAGAADLFSENVENAAADLGGVQADGLDVSLEPLGEAAQPTNEDPLAGLELDGELSNVDAQDDPFSLDNSAAPASPDLDASLNAEEDTLAGVSWAESDANDGELDLGVLQLDEPADATPDPEVDALALDAISDFDSGMWDDAAGETVELQEEQPAKVSRSLESIFSAEDNKGNEAGDSDGGETSDGDPLSALFSDTSLDALEGAAEGAAGDAQEGLTANPFEIDDLENDPFADLMLDDNPAS